MYRSVVRQTQPILNQQEARKEKESIMTRAETTYTKIYGAKIRETDKAIYFRVDTVAQKDAPPAFENHEQDTFWFPISQIKSMDTDPAKIDPDMIQVADWILSSKGII